MGGEQKTNGDANQMGYNNNFIVTKYCSSAISFFAIQYKAVTA